MKSTAPSSSARSVVAQPSLVSDEIINTGIGRNFISRSRNVRPSIRGISTSSVTTSGERALIFSQAMYGSGAVPTTSKSPADSRILVSSCRITAESSTIRTLLRRFGILSHSW